MYDFPRTNYEKEMTKTEIPFAIQFNVPSGDLNFIDAKKKRRYVDETQVAVERVKLRS